MDGTTAASIRSARTVNPFQSNPCTHAEAATKARSTDRASRCFCGTITAITGALTTKEKAKEQSMYVASKKALIEVRGHLCVKHV